MCGIFAYISDKSIDENKYNQLVKEGMKCKHRGPDNTKYRMENENIFLQFHRLSINDLSDMGDQPIMHPQDFNIILICNGEIYNHSDLKTEFNVKCKSKSDCEIILHLYKLIGFEETIKKLDGVFACVLIDINTNSIFAARDRIGVRSMYYGTSDSSYGFSSELKNLHELMTNVSQFPPGNTWSNKTKEFKEYFNPSMFTPMSLGVASDFQKEEVLHNIKSHFINAVKKRLMSDRKIGCLLSGGFDSSILAAVLSREMASQNKKLYTFSIGLEGSPDLKYAKIVAEYLNTEHQEVIVTEKEMIEYIEEDIRMIETYDTTTVRASTPMLLLCKYIKQNTDIAVIFSGEGSDEASGSYLYFHNAPNYLEFSKETRRLLKDLSYFDVLRCDKSTAGAGLEVRVPFLDKNFLEYYMSINPYFKMPKTFSMEKFLLRKAFEEDKYLPNEVLWRVKEGMSDGVSSKKRGWYEIIQEHVNELYTDEEFVKKSANYKYNPPLFKEALYYREIFSKYYSSRDNTIPYYWLPKWSGNIIEPSARVLEGVYPQEMSNKKEIEN